MMQIAFDVRWRVGHGGKPLDPRLFELLRAVSDTGSLKRAARTVRLSYRHAWGLLHAWEDRLGQSLVILERGRGARLTGVGEKLLWADRWVSARLAPELESLASAMQVELTQAVDAEAASPVRIFASHDLALGTLRDLLHEQGHARVELQFRGSLDSLRLLGGGHCELAGFHLAEGRLGRRLAPRYRPWLDARAHRLLHVTFRQQGLMLRVESRGRIHSVADLAQPAVRFVNRQPGCGTRLLFDALMAASGLGPKDLRGYESEEFTHLAVAAMVASGAADAGFGIEAAAAQFGLHFVPVVRERYCLAARGETLSRPGLSAVQLALLGPDFRDRIAGLRGYDPAGAGALLSVPDVLRTE